MILIPFIAGIAVGLTVGALVTGLLMIGSRDHDDIFLP